MAHMGIIPARAGFTLGPVVFDDFDEDHPRSRGVYSHLGSLGHSVRGSSPLARGLRVALINNELNIGIIPARAGFTMA